MYTGQDSSCEFMRLCAVSFSDIGPRKSGSWALEEACYDKVASSSEEL